MRIHRILNANVSGCLIPYLCARRCSTCVCSYNIACNNHKLQCLCVLLSQAYSCFTDTSGVEQVVKDLSFYPGKN